MSIKKGDIYYASLGNDSVGSEQNGVRPVVILQNNIGNKFSPTVIIAPITSKINTKAKLPTHVFIRSLKNGLTQNSLILTEQIQTIDKSRLKSYIGALNSLEITEVNKALIISLGIRITNVNSNYSEYQILTKNQISSYGAVTLNRLKNSGNTEITEKLFKSYMLTLLDLHEAWEIELIYSNLINSIE